MQEFYTCFTWLITMRILICQVYLLCRTDLAVRFVYIAYFSKSFAQKDTNCTWSQSHHLLLLRPHWLQMNITEYTACKEDALHLHCPSTVSTRRGILATVTLQIIDLRLRDHQSLWLGSSTPWPIRAYAPGCWAWTCKLKTFGRSVVG